MLLTVEKIAQKILPVPVWNYCRSIALRLITRNFRIQRLDTVNREWVKLHMGGGDSIRDIEIETVNRCNGVCPFCPVNANQPQRKYAKMTEELFRKIINELAELNYSYRISLFSNNEPFLDERIADFLKYANEKLPNAFFNLYTNGSLLTFEKFIEVIPYIDSMTIDNYNDKREINTPELKKIYDYISHDRKMKKRVHFSFRLLNEVLTSRGGQAPNKIGKNSQDVMNVLCAQPFTQMVIRPTGEVSLCCNDALGKYTMGNLNTQTIPEVWNSKKYKAIRNEMLANGRKNLLLCNQCDSLIGVNGVKDIRPRQRP